MSLELLCLFFIGSSALQTPIIDIKGTWEPTAVENSSKSTWKLSENTLSTSSVSAKLQWPLVEAKETEWQSLLLVKPAVPISGGEDKGRAIRLTAVAFQDLSQGACSLRQTAHALPRFWGCPLRPPCLSPIERGKHWAGLSSPVPPSFFLGGGVSFGRQLPKSLGCVSKGDHPKKKGAFPCDLPEHLCKNKTKTRKVQQTKKEAQRFITPNLLVSLD